MVIINNPETGAFVNVTCSDENEETSAAAFRLRPAAGAGGRRSDDTLFESPCARPCASGHSRRWKSPETRKNPLVSRREDGSLNEAGPKVLVTPTTPDHSQPVKEVGTMAVEANIRTNRVRATRTNPEQNENWQAVGDLARQLVQRMADRKAREVAQ